MLCLLYPRKAMDVNAGAGENARTIWNCEWEILHIGWQTLTKTEEKQEKMIANNRKLC